MTRPYDVHVAVFGQNEAKRLEACLLSISEALGQRNALVTLILNGSTDASADIARATAQRMQQPLRVCTIAQADKSNAINQFFYKLRADAGLYVCVDAYVTINIRAIDALEEKLRVLPDANAATGLAANGRSAPKANATALQQGGVIHGQLYALRPDFLDRLCAAGFRLPVGLYRGDGLIGSMACNDLNGVKGNWVNHRLPGVAGALFSIDQLSLFRLRDWRRHFRRRVRQMRGRIENAAMKLLIERDGFSALPSSADDMIRSYLDKHAPPATSNLDRPFMMLAIRHHRAISPWSAERLVAVCS